MQFFWKYFKIHYSSLLKGMNIYSRASNEYIPSRQSSSSIHSKMKNSISHSLSQNMFWFCENVWQSSLKKLNIFNNNFLQCLSFPGLVISHLKTFQEKYFVINFEDPTVLWTEILWKRCTLGPLVSGHWPEETHLSLVLPYSWKEPGGPKQAHPEENSE